MFLWKNRCRTRKLIDFKRVEKCICSTNEPSWRKAKAEYKQKRKYLTRQSVTILPGGIMYHDV